MSNVYFIGDLHFGHHNISKFRTLFPNEQVHRQFLIDTWNKTVDDKDLTFVMGDAAFTSDGLDSIGQLAGRKILIRGNHDLLPTEAYLEHFEEIYGILMYKGMWLSHAPIHHTELYGRTNVHGHCHRGGPVSVHDAGDDHVHAVSGTKATYFNTCAEWLPSPYVPIRLDDMKERIAKRIRDE
jgi:calcineurin-like phosphoesterase family protein